MFLALLVFSYFVEVCGQHFEPLNADRLKIASLSGDIILGGIFPIHFYKPNSNLSLKEPPPRTSENV